jgi:hypothetical protein
MELYTEGSGKGPKDMALEFRYGQMAQNMKESGAETKPMAKESFGMWMEMCLMENGRMIKLMAMEFILM